MQTHCVRGDPVNATSSRMCCVFGLLAKPVCLIPCAGEALAVSRNGSFLQLTKLDRWATSVKADFSSRPVQLVEPNHCELAVSHFPESPERANVTWEFGADRGETFCTPPNITRGLGGPAK
jgi:hypothetical protein